jgi:iron(II)-dependent oxidoreductase
MVLIPEGTFLLGSEEGKVIEQPVHEVELQAYYMDRYPVTNDQFRLFVQTGGYEDPLFWTEDGWAWLQASKHKHPRFWGEKRWTAPDLPVVGVTWYEVSAYARWAGKRLPTEAEWEKAAAWDPTAGRARRYPWGDKWDAGLCNTKEKQGILGIFKERGSTPVGSYSPGGDSAYGVADMAGNVWEWCSSRWADYPYDPADGREEVDGTEGRVLRGGCWATESGRVRCAIRVSGPPAESDYFRGFRCVVSP